MTAAQDLLLSAADHIERYGWTQSSWYDYVQASTHGYRHCRACAGGALARVTQPEGSSDVEYSPNFLSFEQRREFQSAMTLLIAHLDLEVLPGETGLSAVTMWNDESGRTADEVIAALRGAAA